MPYADPDKQRTAARESARRRRAAKRAESAPPTADPIVRDWPADAGEAISEWSRLALTVPPGHPLSGQPMQVPPYIRAFVGDAMRDGVKEAILCMGRKNSKTGGCAILALAHLCDGAPFAGPGKRLAVVSLDKAKANELRREAEAIAVASKLPGLHFMKSPVPGRVLADNGSELTILAGDKNAGAAGGYDVVFVDECGLFEEKHRPLLESLLGSTGARNGRVIYLSILGNGLFTDPLIRRADDPAVVVHYYRPDPKARITDESAWMAGNPGLDTIKSREHMRSLARKAISDRTYARTFRGEEMNLPVDVSAATIVELDDWRECADREQVPRGGRCWLGVDIGGSASMCGAAAIWETGRIEVVGCWPRFPDLAERGANDKVGDRYERMMERGELVLLGERWADAKAFMRHVQEWLADCDVSGLWADRYRKEEVEEAVGFAFPIHFRRMGAGSDGHADVVAFQRIVADRSVYPGQSLVLESAITESRIRPDENGNMSLHRGRSRGRIDVLSASVIAAGARTRAMAHDDDGGFYFARIA